MEIRQGAITMIDRRDYPSPRQALMDHESTFDRRSSFENELTFETTAPADGIERGADPSLLHAHLLAGNRVNLLRDGAETLPAIFSAIRSAQRFVHLEYYVFEDIHCEGETLSELLVNKRAAGVQIAIIYDAVGSGFTPAAVFEKLRHAGILLLPFNPVNPLQVRRGWAPNRRDHRKILIVDGVLAIVGGINMSTAYESALPPRTEMPHDGRCIDSRRWRDTDLLLEGPAAGQLQQLFIEQWAEQKGECLPDFGSVPRPHTPGEERVAIIDSAPACGRPRYYHALLSALRAAESRVWITAGYFLPTPEQKEALIEAARRQVDVRLLLPSHNDSVAALAVQRFGYGELLRGGIKIYEREGVVLHSKSVIVDAFWSAVGSSNFDHRSVRCNDEVDVVVVGSRTARELARLFLADVRRARAIDPGSWSRRPWHQKVLGLFCKTFESLL